ncbi:UNKNOWN [Stylonychia lemnae]|uniref:Uncharacterized protein n=1 Tax=Stylonychia lemnae TaxID=5949 RepID=A0A078AW21_STYLE|nr:UNKNOWN [Stylonychia lemnae]|eukprot:CDW85412.1 UNKNOWN [Stylonychia lemnae]
MFEEVAFPFESNEVLGLPVPIPNRNIKGRLFQNAEEAEQIQEYKENCSKFAIVLRVCLLTLLYCYEIHSIIHRCPSGQQPQVLVILPNFYQYKYFFNRIRKKFFQLINSSSNQVIETQPSFNITKGIEYHQFNNKNCQFYQISILIQSEQRSRSYLTNTTILIFWIYDLFHYAQICLVHYRISCKRYKMVQRPQAKEEFQAIQILD